MKDFQLDCFVRENIKNLKPYSSARDEYQEVSEDMVFIDANENPFQTSVNRYPDPQQTKVKQLLSELRGIPVNQILLGNGSDEVLDLIVRAFCEPNQDEIMILPPTYGMYKVLAGINALKVKEVQLTSDFQPDVDRILEEATQRTKILFLCSPNNPTANSFEAELIDKLVSEFNGIVVIDEAYIDFSTSESWIGKLDSFPNLIVTQTMSKAYGMAGIRLGICCASEEIISLLNRIKPPYNVNELTQRAAIERLKNQPKVEEQIELINSEREKLMHSLQNVSIVEQVFPSDANFILARVDDATKRYNELVNQGIVVRNRSGQPLCHNCLRFTVGTKNENSKLIEVLKELS